MFKAHINIEYCHSVKSIKYICEYVNKGNDMAIFGLSKENTNDEISQYLLGRYISSNEAVWRILSFPIHERHPNVVHLSVHLENGQRVYFTNANARTVAAAPPNTTLTAFFQLCQQDPFAKKLLYPEVPRYYTWNASRKSFCRRKQGTSVPEHEGIFASEALGQVYTVHPNNAECFFLRMLLHTVRGPTSFSSLKCVNGEECRTFREACQNLGLLEDDQHWDNVLSEAASQSFPEQIRELFAILLTTCNPSNPQNLWEKYRESMSEDVLIKARRANPTLDINFSSDIFNEALLLLQNKCLAINDKTLSQLGLQSPERCQPTILNRELMRENNYNIEQLRRFVDSKKPLLVEDQREAYNSIMDCINKQQGGIIFLDAPGGTGKTFLINLLLAEVRSKNAIALAIASSGIAATLIDGGRTAHSMLKLPLNIANEQYPTCNISSTSGQAQVLKSCRIIVWDECTMAHKNSLEALDRTLRDLKGNNKLMGGILLLLAGDFRQTLPVIPRSTPADEINACLKASNFARKLLQIGEGTTPNGSPMCDVSFPLDFGNIVSSVGELIDKVFPNIAENFKNHRLLCERTILAPRNDAVDEINNCIQDMLPGSVTEYNSFNTMVDVDDTVNYPSEFLNSLNPSGLPPHHLRLKIGSPIMLLRNLDPPKLCNGTRLCVKRLLPNVIEAIILTGKENGKDVFIPRIPLIPNDFPFLFKRLQFPVRLAFAITINKAQGQSLKCCDPCKTRHRRDSRLKSLPSRYLVQQLVEMQVPTQLKNQKLYIMDHALLDPIIKSNGITLRRSEDHTRTPPSPRLPLRGTTRTSLCPIYLPLDTPNPEPKPVYPRKTYNKSPDSNKNRTEDGRPICFKCNKPGHVAWYCRVRFVIIVEEDPIVAQDMVEEEIRMNKGTEKSRPRLYADESNSTNSNIHTRNRYARQDQLGKASDSYRRCKTEKKHKPYRVSAKERTIIKDQIDEMLEEGIIRPSSSPWSIPVILVRKLDGKYRFCVDYRKLNEVTVNEVYPIPRIDDVMDTLQGSKYFSAIDLKSGYWQVEIEERDKEKTAFTTAHGLYEFNVMPFSLFNAPDIFERSMDNALGNLR
ncbi:hypothetical protein LAZ67_8001384 [Cordylochernes scorpioides]|uniref:ATP-dependent DNA helicase n=1 Tax=Cordylochernes scorpioides TaxID=51811 RepID=A0ABY6KQN6_9ARAC|nr:hypothetical protein LAZ67_8001384 [Cordylochernes scorpioides]